MPIRESRHHFIGFLTEEAPFQRVYGRTLYRLLAGVSFYRPFFAWSTAYLDQAWSAGYLDQVILFV